MVECASSIEAIERRRHDAGLKSFWHAVEGSIFGDFKSALQQPRKSPDISISTVPQASFMVECASSIEATANGGVIMTQS